MASEKHDYILCIVSASGLVAADMNGKSDPYVHYWHKRKDDPSTSGKTRVVKKTLNPVWRHSHTLVSVSADAEVTFDVYDKDVLGKDDFLGTVSARLKDLCNTKADPINLPLLSREGKKDKVTGHLTVSCGRCGRDNVELGPTLTYFYTRDVFGADGSDFETYVGVSKMWNVYREATHQCTHTLDAKQVSAFMRKAFEGITTISAEVSQNLINAYDDSGDGKWDWSEIMTFIRDSRKVGEGKLEAHVIMREGWFGISMDDGEVNFEKLKETLPSLIKNVHLVDPKVLEVESEKAAKEMMKAMDLDGNGHVTASEVRQYSLGDPSFFAIIKRLNQLAPAQ